MATIKVLDTELELDLLDADELEKVDAAIQAVEGDAQQDPALSQADNMRKQVGAVRKAFDTIFGEGTGLRVMGEKNHSLNSRMLCRRSAPSLNAPFPPSRQSTARTGRSAGRRRRNEPPCRPGAHRVHAWR